MSSILIRFVSKAFRFCNFADGVFRDRIAIQRSCFYDYFPLGVYDDEMFVPGSSYCLSSQYDLLASGGEFGHIAMYDVSPFLSREVIKPASLEDGLGMDEVQLKRPAILASRGLNERWTSDLTFVSREVMCSSSDDGCLRLWSTFNGSNLAGVLVDEMHAKGVYTCDSENYNIASGLKDGTVRLFNGDLQCVRTWGTKHGVVKSVRFKDANVFASCGNDRTFRLNDIRAKDVGSSECDPYARAVNFLDWNFCDRNKLLVTAYDDEMSLYDVRNVKHPYLHLRLGLTRQILKPCWVGTEACKIVFGSGHLLFCYDSSSGEHLFNCDFPFGKAVGQVCNGRKDRDDILCAVSADGTVMVLQNQIAEPDED